MNSEVGEKYVAELIRLFDRHGDALSEGQHTMCLTIPCVDYLQRKFAQLQETSGAPVPSSMSSYHRLQEHFARILSLKLISDRRSIPLNRTSNFTLSLEPYRALQSLTLKKVPLNLVTGLQRLRGQLCVLVVQRCELAELDDIVVRCGGDNSTTLGWSKLRELDFSHNLLRKLGDSLQYLYCLEKVNFSNNQIGKRPHISGETSSSSTITSSSSGSNDGSINSVAVVQPNQEQERAADVATEGIELIDCVQFLHLGFNKLRQIPKFGSRTRYNLRILNLRNNQLVKVDGLEELDNLVELDLTDNLLSKHISLEPFSNLHHLSILVLLGNPLCFHPKHRLKTAEQLSNLIDKISFKLDGKKLSSSERKVVRNVMTHHYSPYSRNSSLDIPTVTTPTLLDPPVAQSVPTHLLSGQGSTNVTLDGSDGGGRGGGGGGGGGGGEESRGNGLDYTSVPSSPQREAILAKKGHRKSWHAAKIIDPDDDSGLPRSPEAQGGGKPKSLYGAKVNSSVDEAGPVSKKVAPKDESGRGHKGRRGSRRKKRKEKRDDLLDSRSVPLMHEQKLKKHKDMRLMMTDNWLQVSLDKSSSANDATIDSEGRTSSVDTREAEEKMQPPTSPGSISLPKRHLHDESIQQKRENMDVVLNECEGEFGPRTSSPDRDYSQEIEGDYYVVERYESDVEEDKSGIGGVARDGKQQVMIRLSEDFLEEIDDTSGMVLDRWDLHCLETATVASKQWQSAEQKINVLRMEFNLERRDRRRREYVLLEEGDQESIMEMLEPMVEQNQSTLSMGNKLECLQCQHVFDKARAIDQPSDSPEPLRSSVSYRGRAISKLMCPFCHSQILQQSVLSKPSVPGKHLNRISSNGSPAVTDPVPLHTSDSNIVSGFDVNLSSGPAQKSTSDVTPMGSDHLREFINQQTSDSDKQTSSGIGSNSSTGTNREANEQLVGWRDQHLSDHKDEPDGRMSVHVRELDQVAGERCVPLVEHDSPPEPGFLKGYGGTRVLNKTDEMTLLQDREEGACGIHARPPTIEDTLSPWKNPDIIKAPGKSTSSELTDGVREDYKAAENDSKYKESVGFRSRENHARHLNEGQGEGRKSKGDGGMDRWGDDGKLNQDWWGKGGKQNQNRFVGGEQLRKGQLEDGGIVSQDRWGEGGKAGTDRWGDDISHSKRTRDTDRRGRCDRDVELQAALSDGDVAKNPFEAYDYVPESESAQVSRSRNIPHPAPNLTQDPFSSPSHLDNYSKSMPTPNFIQNYFRHQEGSSDSTSAKASSSPPAKSKLRRDPYEPSSSSSSKKLHGSNRSLRSLKEENVKPHSSKSSSTSSIKSSVCSLDTDSSPERRSRSRANSTDKKAHGGLNEKIQRRRGSNDKFPQGYSSGESRTQQSRSKGEGIGGNRTPSKSPKLNGRGSSNAPSSRKASGGSSSRISSSSGDNARAQRQLRPSHSSSDSASKQKMASTSVFCKDDDPSYIHNSINLYLDIDVFDSTKGESFRMAFRSPVVKYGEVGELPVLVVVSNLCAYIFKIVAPESSDPTKWLKLGYRHSLHKLVYIDHGVAYQFLRVEFKSAGACYTFVMRDDMKCRLCSTQLSLCVADAPGSSLRNVGVCPFNIEALRYPDRVRREVITNRYENAKGRKSPTGSLGRPASCRTANGDSLVLYRLAHRYHHDTGGRSPVTLVVTEDTLFLAKENFSHWPLPRMQDLVLKEALLPPFLDIEQRNIIDVEKIILDSDQSNYAIVRFFLENCGYGESRQWKLLLHSPECVTKLVDAIKTPWEREFELETFPVVFK